jgi:hypothetical protein
MTDSLAAIMAKLDQNNQTQNDNYNRLQSLVNSINSTSLADIKGQLVALKGTTDALGVDLAGKLGDFRNTTLARLENITMEMATMDDIKALSDQVNAVQGQMNTIKDEQATTSKNVSNLGTPSWGSMVLILIVLVVAVLLLVMSRGGRKKGAATPEATPVNE